jgi:ribonuclease Z
MEIIFLGTSSGMPTKTRNVSAIAIKYSNSKSWYLVDCGEGTQHQILATKLSMNNLDAVFITHAHGDHCYGLPGLLASAAMQGRTRTLKIIAPVAISDFLHAIINTTQLTLSYEIEFIGVESLTATLRIGNFLINTVELSHRVQCYAYSFTECQVDAKLNTEKLIADGIDADPIWGILQDGKNVRLDNGRLLIISDYTISGHSPRKIVIGGDNDNPNLLTKSCLQANLLIHEATYTHDIAKQLKHHKHSSAHLVSKFANEIGVPNLILTHFSARYQKGVNSGLSIMDIENEAKSAYNGKLFLANDFDVFKLDRTGQIKLLVEGEENE